MTPLDAALSYAARGWAVLPVHSVTEAGCTCGRAECERPGKHPRARHGVKDATTDEQIIRSWWGAWPNANVAIATGAPSGVWALDVDAGGEDVLNELEDEHSKRPDTPEQHTGGGGMHVLFSTGGLRIPNRVRFQRGLDVRGDGGYILLPPSVHATGAVYEWDGYLGPDTPLAEAPVWLLELIGALQKGADPAEPARPPVKPAEVFAGVEQGARNNELFRYCCRLVRQGLTEIEVRNLARIAASAAKPPLPDTEVQTIVRSAMRYRESETPVPLGTQSQLPPFPAEVLAVPGRALADWVRDVAEVRQVPPDLPGMLLLSVLGACCAGRVRVQVGGSHSVPTNIYTATAMQPGSRKSSVLRDMVAPLERIETEEARRIGPIRKNALERTEADEARLGILRKKVAKAGSSIARDAILGEIAVIQEEMEEPPVEPRLLVGGDVSLEKLAMLLHEHGEVLALFDDEGGLFNLLSGLYTGGKVNLDLILKAWAGDAHRVDRVGRESVHLAAPLLTIGLCVQPDVIRSLADQSAFRGRGLLGRFSYSIPPSLVGSRLYLERGLRADLAEAYHSLISELYYKLESRGQPLTLALTGEALQIWKRFHDRVERDQAPGKRLEHLADWASKLAGTVAGIAGTFHCVRYLGSDQDSRIIDVDTVLAAWAIGEYLVAHAEAAFGVMVQDPDLGLAERILEWIRAEKIKTFTMRELQQRFKGAGPTRQAGYQPALTILEERGYLRQVEPQYSGRGRRPGAAYTVVSGTVLPFPAMPRSGGAS